MNRELLNWIMGIVIIESCILYFWSMIRFPIREWKEIREERRRQLERKERKEKKTRARAAV